MRLFILFGAGILLVGIIVLAAVRATKKGGCGCETGCPGDCCDVKRQSK